MKTSTTVVIAVSTLTLIAAAAQVVKAKGGSTSPWTSSTGTTGTFQPKYSGARNSVHNNALSTTNTGHTSIIDPHPMGRNLNSFGRGNGLGRFNTFGGFGR